MKSSKIKKNAVRSIDCCLSESDYDSKEEKYVRLFTDEIGNFISFTLTKHQNKRGFNFEEIAKNYKDFFKKQGCGLYSLIVLSGDFEYHLLDLNFIKNNFEYSICSSKTYIQKKWLTRRPSTEYTLFLEEELLDSHVIFKIYGPKEKN